MMVQFIDEQALLGLEELMDRLLCEGDHSCKLQRAQINNKL